MGFLNDIIGGFFGNETADKVADSQVQAARDSNETLMQMFQMGNDLTAPNREAGYNALAMQGSLLGNPNMVPQDAIATATGQPTAGSADYAGYVTSRPDLSAAYSGLRPQDTTYIKNKGFDADGNGQISQSEYGNFHYSTMGQNEGRTLPTVGGTSGQTTGQVGTAQPAVGVGTSVDEAYNTFLDSGFNRAMTDVTQQDLGMIKDAYGAAGSSVSGSAQGAMQDRLAGNRYNAFGDYYSALSGISGTGAELSSQASSNALNTGQSMAGNELNVGNARASSYQTQGANNANLANSGVNALASWFGGF
jgi:hypothetical protein